MQEHKFGGKWTEEKLERLKKYLIEYTTIFTKSEKAKYFSTIYVDAFAGSGYRTEEKKTNKNLLFPELDTETQKLFKGSAMIALEVDPPFNKYLFIDNKPKHIKDLEKLKSQYQAKDIEIVNAEANAFLTQWCKNTNWNKWRAVVFLDPYGMQVEWSTLEAIAKTQAIDLWYLFPLIGVYRMLTKNEPPPAEWKEILNRLLGTPEWESHFYQSHKQTTLFGEKEVLVRDADFDKIKKYIVERLSTIFTKVAKNPLVLKNYKNVPLFLLCLAAGNPKGADIAIRIGEHILKEK